MSVNVSVRLDDGLAERLRLRARAAGESLSDRLRRYAEEGARRDEHPMITFRDGPTGRRAGLIGGPDVWEVAMWLDELGSTKDRAADLASDEVVSRPQIDAALAYRAAYPDEIQAQDRASPQRDCRGRSSVKLILDEMYPPALAEGLNAVEVDARTVADWRLSGSSDAEVFGAAVASGRSILTENVGDFTRIAADHSTAGHRHLGVLIALSSRFSRRQPASRA